MSRDSEEESTVYTLVVCIVGLVVLACIILLGSMLVAGCNGKRVDWPSIVSCGAPIASDVFTHVWDTVVQDGFAPVFSDASVSALEDAARTYGASTVACVLSELLDKLAPRGVDAIDLPTADRMAAKRVQAFLHHHEIEVSR